MMDSGRFPRRVIKSVGFVAKVVAREGAEELSSEGTVEEGS